MKRGLEKFLLDWKKDPAHKPIILRGARQVGKSYLVNSLGQTFDSYVEINFDLDESFLKIFEQDRNPERIIRDLALATGKRIIPGETLLFLDEIQECPNAIQALRYFYEKMPKLHVIGAGSLIDFTLEKIGVPVGRVEMLNLYPMSFAEFLRAKEKDLLIEELAYHDPSKELSEVAHNQLLRLYLEYMAVGGMPEAIAKWLQSSDLKKVKKVHRSLISTYQQDFTKYTNRFQEKYVDLVYSSVPRLSGKKFVYASINANLKSRELKPALELLQKAAVIHAITHTSSGGIPLAGEINPLFFKAIMSDIGLMQSMLDVDSGKWILQQEQAATNFGAVIEAFVGQELLAYAPPDQKKELFYWARQKRGSTAEVDYVTELKGQVIPIEVKAGKSYALKSMELFLNEKQHSPYGIHFSPKNFSFKSKIRQYPLYAVRKAITQD